MDQDLPDVLAKVNLICWTQLDVALRAGEVTLDWSNILSLGEQQRLAFGRLLVMYQLKLATQVGDCRRAKSTTSYVQKMAQPPPLHRAFPGPGSARGIFKIRNFYSETLPRTESHSKDGGHTYSI